MNSILLSFSFVAGLQAFFVPCSIALIPAYVGYYVNEETGNAGRAKQLLFGLKAGVVSGLGLLTIYIIFGIILTLASRVVAPFVPWIELFTGGILLFFGAATLLGYEFTIRPPIVIGAANTRGLKRFYLFGIAYAFGAIGCTLPIFLLVIFQGLAQQGPFGAFMNFASYAGAMVGLMITFSLVAAVSKTAIQRFLNRYMLAIQKSAGALVLLGGIYLVYLSLKVIMI